MIAPIVIQDAIMALAIKDQPFTAGEVCVSMDVPADSALALPAVEEQIALLHAAHVLRLAGRVPSGQCYALTQGARLILRHAIRVGVIDKLARA